MPTARGNATIVVTTPGVQGAHGWVAHAVSHPMWNPARIVPPVLASRPLIGQIVPRNTKT